MNNLQQSDFYVGNWLVEPALSRINLKDRGIHLQARWMSVLVYLAENTDRPVSAEEIIEDVWGDIHVTQDSVYLTVSQLRKSLAEDPAGIDYIETIPRAGYRLIAPVIFPEVEKTESNSRNKKRLIFSAVAAMVLMAIIFLPDTFKQVELTVTQIPNSIAVLPFVDLESGKDSNLSVLFADDLMNQLTTVEGLEVMARTSSFSMDDRSITAQEIGRQLGVSTILEGSIRRNDKYIHVIAQLIDTSNGLHLWSGAFDRDRSTFWEIQDEMAQQIAQAMGLDMPPAYLQTLDAIDRPIVKRTRVNSYTSNIQEDPSVIVLKNRRYLIAWRSKDQDGSNWGTYAQLFDEESGGVGNEFRINATSVESQYNTVFAVYEDGGFMAAWQSWLIDGSGWGVIGRVFDQEGRPKTDETGINVFNVGEQLHPTIAIDPNGRILAVYASNQPEASEHEIMARWLDTEGTPIGEEHRLNSFVRGRQTEPRLLSLSGGGFVVVWVSSGSDGSGFGIAGRLLDKSGRPAGPEFNANSYVSGNQQGPELIALAGGGFIVAWESSDQDNDGMGGWGVFAQRFDAEGTQVGSEFGINEFTSSTQSAIALTVFDDDRFYAAWESENQAGKGTDIFGRRFDVYGQPMSPGILINVVTNSYQRKPRLATLSDGSVIVVFAADDWDGSYFGIFSRRLVFNDGSALQAKTGADTFVFDEPFDHAEIQGFDAEIDRIALPGLSMKFEALRIEPNEGGLIIHMGTSTIQVAGVVTLEAGHFLF